MKGINYCIQKAKQGIDYAVNNPGKVIGGGLTFLVMAGCSGAKPTPTVQLVDFNPYAHMSMNRPQSAPGDCKTETKRTPTANGYKTESKTVCKQKKEESNLNLIIQERYNNGFTGDKGVGEELMLAQDIMGGVEGICITYNPVDAKNYDLKIEMNSQKTFYGGIPKFKGFPTSMLKQAAGNNKHIAAKEASKFTNKQAIRNHKRFPRCRN